MVRIKITRDRINNSDSISTFDIGTCGGSFTETDNSIDIYGIYNKEKGNGHLNHVFEYFESECIKNSKSLFILYLQNDNFKKHLIEKRGFIKHGENSVVKYFKK